MDFLRRVFYPHSEDELETSAPMEETNSSTRQDLGDHSEAQDDADVAIEDAEDSEEEEQPRAQPQPQPQAEAAQDPQMKKIDKIAAEVSQLEQHLQRVPEKIERHRARVALAIWRLRKGKPEASLTPAEWESVHQSCKKLRQATNILFYDTGMIGEHLLRSQLQLDGVEGQGDIRLARKAQIVRINEIFKVSDRLKKLAKRVTLLNLRLEQMVNKLQPQQQPQQQAQQQAQQQQTEEKQQAPPTNNRRDSSSQENADTTSPKKAKSKKQVAATKSKRKTKKAAPQPQVGDEQEQPREENATRDDSSFEVPVADDGSSSSSTMDEDTNKPQSQVDEEEAPVSEAASLKARAEELGLPRWEPHFSVEQQNNGSVLILGQLPGVRESDLAIRFNEQSRVLTVSGIKMPKRQQSRTAHASPFAGFDFFGRSFAPVVRPEPYGWFEVSFEVPANFRAQAAKTSFRQGLLTISVPREAPKSCRRQQPTAAPAASSRPRSSQPRYANSSPYGLFGFPAIDTSSPFSFF